MGTPQSPVSIETLEERIASLEETVNTFNANMTTAIDLLQTIKDNIEPALEAISKSPIGKMFGIKG